MYLNLELRTELERVSGWELPEHDILSYLLRKLPEIRLETWHNGQVVVKHYTANGVPSKLERLGKVMKAEADTPEDAACKLLVELIKQDIIKV